MLSHALDPLLADLRQQSLAESRTRYDGHNRQPQRVTLRMLGQRRVRRRWRRLLWHWVWR